MQERGLRAARERLGEIAYKAVDNLDWAMDSARSENDYEAMPKITGQVLERTMPRRDDLSAGKLTINIQLSERQHALLHSPLEPIEAEIVEHDEKPAD